VLTGEAGFDLLGTRSRACSDVMAGNRRSTSVKYVIATGYFIVPAS
jgi:hypothetical protein